MAQKNRWEIQDYPMIFLLNSHFGLLRLLRSNDKKCWMLLWPQNFAIKSKGKVEQTVPNFWFIWLWYISLTSTIISRGSEHWNRLSYRGLPYLFKGRSQTFRNNCKISRSQPENSTFFIIRPQQPRKTKVRIWKNIKRYIIPFFP